MIQQLSWSITNLFIRREEISDEDGEIYAFGFECILSTVIQIGILLVIGLIFNCLIEITIFSLFFTRIKGYIGGYHANTHLACISGFAITALIMVSICKILPCWTTAILVIIGLILVLILAPIQHVNNPKTDKEMFQARKKAVSVAMILAAVICVILLTPFKQYAIFGAAGFCIATVSLAIPSKYYT